MIFSETRLPGAYILEPEKKFDDRGFFARLWCQEELGHRGLPSRFVQSNVSSNRSKGTLRGMHWQNEPFAEDKLIRCAQGAIHLVMLDLRAGSATFKQWAAVELRSGDYKTALLPKGLAAGFLTLEDDSEVIYHMSEFFRPEYAAGARYDDPAFGIVWPVPVRVISEKDRSWPDFSG
jgi:dTDP-4-dehydrorhamnose 3,5-epimerase